MTIMNEHSFMIVHVGTLFEKIEFPEVVLNGPSKSND